MIRVENVTKHFDKYRVLDSISLHVPKGAIYGLVGPNGAGKTTVINHITGVYKPESGVVTIGGKNVFDSAETDNVISIADDWFFYNAYSIKEMAQFYKNIYQRFDEKKYEELRDIFALDEKRQIRKLSKGMKKQVAFILSLSAKPDVLILDEPLDGLDPVMRKQVLNLMIAEVADREMTVLVSSHNLRELEDICDHVGIIHDGKMILEKPLDDLKGNVHKYQTVFNDKFPAELMADKSVMNVSNAGSVYNIIIKGEAEKCEELIKTYSPILAERVSLTLEEIFIYELGGVGYDCKNIL